MTELFINSIGDFSEEWFQQSYRKLSDFRQEKADRFRMREDRLVSILSGTLLREALLSRGISDRDVLIKEHGKPFLPEEPPYFSISHTGPAAILAISDEAAVGADVEKIPEENDGGLSRARNWQAIARRFYTDSEKEYLDKLEEEVRVKAFFRLWTCKEAYGKLMGGGLEDGLPFSAEKVLEKAEIRDSKDIWGDLDKQLRFCSISERMVSGGLGKDVRLDSIMTARIETLAGRVGFCLIDCSICHRSFLATICINGLGEL